LYDATRRLRAQAAWHFNTRAPAASVLSHTHELQRH